MGKLINLLLLLALAGCGGQEGSVPITHGEEGPTVMVTAGTWAKAIAKLEREIDQLKRPPLLFDIILNTDCGQVVKQVRTNEPEKEAEKFLSKPFRDREGNHYAVSSVEITYSGCYDFTPPYLSKYEATPCDSGVYRVRFCDRHEVIYDYGRPGDHCRECGYSRDGWTVTAYSLGGGSYPYADEIICDSVWESQ